MTGLQCLRLYYKSDEVASTSPSVVVEEAIGGWYQLYLRSTYENWPRREEDLESLVILPQSTIPWQKCFLNWFFKLRISDGNQAG